MKTKFIKAFSLAILTVLCITTARGNGPLTKTNPLSKETKIEKKIDSLLHLMTLEEKIEMLHGNGTFTSAGVKRLGIPDFTSADGPLGVREEIVRNGWAAANWTTDSATFFPNGSALAATWNPKLAFRYGEAIGEEAHARNKNMLLAPAINITRTPLGGRTFEYMSEDPLLNGRLAVAAIQGIQTQPVAACVKHFALNNQETERGLINVEVSERALREIYLPAFKAAIQEGHALTVMAAYNKFRGVYCAENDYLLNKILRGEWNFKGLVVSDWGGVHSTIGTGNTGLEIEMGSSGSYDKWYMATPLLDAVKAGKVSMTAIDAKVVRILRVMLQTSMKKNVIAGELNTPKHYKTAYDIASESIVLLKNEKQLLPLNSARIKSIAVIGDNATRRFASGGFGAGVKTKYEITALKGLENKLGKSVSIQFAQGYSAKMNRDKKVTTPDPKLITDAVELARKSDVAIIFIGSNRIYEEESIDRSTLELPFNEQALVNAVTAVNPNTIVVVVAAAPYDLNEIKKNNHTIVWSWFNGSEGGNALADVLIGKVNPSGKFPFTFPVKLDDSPAHALNTFPGENQKADYKEGILVGYRWFDTKNIDPLYCFGYGLSYTTFTYSALTTNQRLYSKDEKISVTVKVKNTGKIAGKETVQLYVSHLKSTVLQPEKELRNFQKILVNAGKESLVKMELNVNDLAYFDETSNKWVVEPGTYKIMVGSSSKDIRQTTEITIK
ncbi:MAG: glycoside hydrolase family 3 C-terminal domain-containing protein [Bacteroidetes bacterium]|nr:glycoside hydrolase family 3 C-terminal domain-containing protein [Bacteroidota bacterium]